MLDCRRFSKVQNTFDFANEYFFEMVNNTYYSRGISSSISIAFHSKKINTLFTFAASVNNK